ncbi:MAG: hypothetical protein V3S12_01465 [Acidiferrobacterales bacterium]
MAVCSHTSNCELFPMISVNSALKVWRTFYCETKWHECARFKLSLEGKSVPPNLLPNGKSLDLGIGKPQVAAKPAPVAVKTRTAGKSALAEVENEIADINLNAPAPALPVSAPAPVATASGDTMSYYLRMQIVSSAGVMTQIIRSLGQSHVRIDAVTEKKGVGEGGPSYLIVLTDQVDESILGSALTALENLNCVQGNIKRVVLEKMSNGQLV